MKVIKADPNTFLLIDIEGLNAELVPVIAWRVCPRGVSESLPVTVPHKYAQCNYPAVFLDHGIIADDHGFVGFQIGLSVNDADLIASRWREANKE